MIVRNLITDMVPSVKTSDTVGRALDWMNEFKLPQLPVVDHGKYLGMITEDEILEVADPMLSVGEVLRHGWETVTIYASKHVYDAISLMSNNKIEVVSVLNDQDQYEGAVTLRDLSAYLSQVFVASEAGGIIVIEIPPRGYSLSEIGRIVESADAKVLSLYLSALDQGGYLATLKLNVEDVTRVVAAFERFEYKVLHTFFQAAQVRYYRENLDALFNYLDI